MRTQQNIQNLSHLRSKAGHTQALYLDSDTREGSTYNLQRIYGVVEDILRWPSQQKWEKQQNIQNAWRSSCDDGNGNRRQENCHFIFHFPWRKHFRVLKEEVCTMERVSEQVSEAMTKISISAITTNDTICLGPLFETSKTAKSSRQIWLLNIHLNTVVAAVVT